MFFASSRINEMSKHYRGYILSLLAYFFYSSMDSCVKLAAGVPAFQTVTLTYGITLICTLVFYRIRLRNFEFIAPPRQHIPWLVLRGTLFFGVSALAFLALKQVPLPGFYATFFTSPLLVTLLAALWLKEQVRPQQWLMMILGFIGVLIVFRPWSHEWNPGLLLVAVAAFIHACNNVLARRLCQHVSDATNLCWTLSVGFIWALLLAWPDWKILEISEWQLLGLAGFFTVLANLLFIQAIYQLDASRLAITHYSQIIWGVLFGYLFWQELPDLQTFCGASLIIIAGILMVRGNRVKPEFPPTP